MFVRFSYLHHPTKKLFMNKDILSVISYAIYNTEIVNNGRGFVKHTLNEMNTELTLLSGTENKLSLIRNKKFEYGKVLKANSGWKKYLQFNSIIEYIEKELLEYFKTNKLLRSKVQTIKEWSYEIHYPFLKDFIKKKITPLFYLTTSIDLLKEIDIRESVLKNDFGKKENSSEIKSENVPYGFQWNKLEDFKRKRINDLISEFKKSGIISKDSSTSEFKKIFTKKCSEPKLNFIGKENAVANLLYFMYLLWDDPEMKRVNVIHHRFSLLKKCFLTNHQIISNKNRTLSSLYSQIKKKETRVKHGALIRSILISTLTK